jgi:hypothetical protein
MRIIFVPQYPTPNRYQEWWFWKLPEEFRKAGHEVKVLGEIYSKHIKVIGAESENFSPIQQAIDFELQQIKEFSSLKFGPDDVLFLADLSFPGLFCNILYHNHPPKMYAFCHATSLNKLDYFQPVRASKFPVESAHAMMFNKIFVGSDYHARKLLWQNTVVTSLPNPTHIKQCKNEVKFRDIVSASRLSNQKVDLALEAEVANKFGPITRKFTNSAEEYYQFLGESKVLLITSHEDTFGYQIVDAINNGCIPIARNDLSYPELLQDAYLYNNKNELFNILEQALWGLLDVPKLKCKKQMDDFYKRIINEMTKEREYPF